jgi:acyl-coenzyme A synthetase/AMP-(fatty) acid ligase
MEWLIDRFREGSTSVAFIHNDKKTTYEMVVCQVEKFTKILLSKGVSSGDLVIVHGDYSPHIFSIILALAINKNIIIPLTNESIVEIDSVLSVSGSDWIIKLTEDEDELNIKRILNDVTNPLINELSKNSSPGLVLFSSGSTGKPKGILHNLDKVTEKFRLKRNSTIAIPFLMIDHFGGINTILAITSSLGTVVTVESRSIEIICSAIERYKVELLPATPSFLTLLLASGAYKKYKLSSLKKITYGTEVMPASTLKKLQVEFSEVQFQQTYGLSEVGVLRSQSRGDGSLWVKIGGEGFETKIIDDILWIKSDYAMVGYLNAESQFCDGWFNTQDKVEVDGDYFKILGRVTDLINIGGQKVYPAEVESVVLEMENIEDVAVFGELHNLLGQSVVAKIKTINFETADDLKKRVRIYCKGKLANFKIPSKIILVDKSLTNTRQKKIRR